MAPAPACGSCGHRLPHDARWCPRCGARAGDAPVLDLEPEPGAPIPGQGTATGDGPSGSRAVSAPRWAPVLGAAGAIVAFAVAIGLALGTGERRTDDDTEGTPTTRAAPTTAGAASVTTGRAPAATTAIDPPASSLVPAPFRPRVLAEGGRAPILGEATGGHSLYVLEGNALARIDLDTGRHVQIPVGVRGGSPEWTRVVVAGDRVVLVGRRLGHLPADLTQPVTAIEVDLAGWEVMAVEPGGAVWMTRYEAIGGIEVTTGDVDPGLGPLHQVRLPSGAAAAGVVEGHVVATAGGGIFLVAADGRATRFGDGVAMAVSDPWILWYGCGEGLRCEFRVGTRTQPIVHRFSLAGATPRLSEGAVPASASVSPDGTHAVVVGRHVDDATPTSASVLVDLERGEVVEMPLPPNRWTFAPVWTPDGRWLFRFFRGGSAVAVDAVDPRSGTVVGLGDFGLDDAFPVVRIAVG